MNLDEMTNEELQEKIFEFQGLMEDLNWYIRTGHFDGDPDYIEEVINNSSDAEAALYCLATNLQVLTKKVGK